jgi:hypothetical protein
MGRGSNAEVISELFVFRVIRLKPDRFRVFPKKCKIIINIFSLTSFLSFCKFKNFSKNLEIPFCIGWK